MKDWLASPPAALVIVLFAVVILSRIFSRLALAAGIQKPGTKEPYACGESNYDHMAQPDYSEFFPFAFFFTLAHVATLIITTVPAETAQAFIMAAIYIIGAMTGLYILFKR